MTDPILISIYKELCFISDLFLYFVISWFIYLIVKISITITNKILGE